MNIAGKSIAAILIILAVSAQAAAGNMYLTTTEQANQAHNYA
jgi:hypothetical protein